MRNVWRKLNMVLLCFIMLGNLESNAQETWNEVKLNSLNALDAGQHMLVHPKFFVAAQKMKPSIKADEIHTALHVSKEGNNTFMFTFLAADNPMKWTLKILDDTHAEWYDLSCDCNVGLESSVFSNNRNPYKKLIATLTLNNKGEIEVVYADNFRKDFLNKATFSNDFFLDSYKIYQKQQ